MGKISRIAGGALANMVRLNVTRERSGRRRRTLAAAGLCAAVLFSGGAQAQPALSESSAQETTLDTPAVDLVAQRVSASLPREMSANFNLFIYIDKAERGPFAQRMFVFETTGGTLALRYDWPVSTGRESLERDAHGHLQSSITPVGYFELDPRRMFENHVSSQWNEEMPYAMFFDWKPNGHQTGLAIHGVVGGESDTLGTPASAGCVRISEQNARTLFDFVRNAFRAPVPEISYPEGSRNVGTGGFLLHDPDGRLKIRDGYSALIVVDNYIGESQASSPS
jgi:hypothetical protein